MRLTYEPASEPLYIFVKKLCLTITPRQNFRGQTGRQGCLNPTHHSISNHLTPNPESPRHPGILNSALYPPGKYEPASEPLNPVKQLCLIITPRQNFKGVDGAPGVLKLTTSNASYEPASQPLHVPVKQLF